MLSATVVMVFRHYDDAQQAVRQRNDRPLHLVSRPARALTRTVTAPTTRHVARPGFHCSERIVVDRWTLEIGWGRRRDMRPGECAVAELNTERASPTAGERS